MHLLHEILVTVVDFSVLLFESFGIIVILLATIKAVVDYARHDIEQEFKAPYQDVLSIYRSAPFFIEVMAQNIDKAASLEKLCEYLGMTSEDMIAFGDGFNDISMIKFAGLGVAMGNAQDVVKEAANEITLSNDEEGIYETLKRVVGL